MAPPASSPEAGQFTRSRCSRTRSCRRSYQCAAREYGGDQARDADQRLDERRAESAAESGAPSSSRHAPWQPGHAHEADPHESRNPRRIERQDRAGHEQATEGKDPPREQVWGFPRGLGRCGVAGAADHADQHGAEGEQAPQDRCAQGCGAQCGPGRCGIGTDAERTIREDPHRVRILGAVRIEGGQGECRRAVEWRRDGIVPTDQPTEPRKAHDQRGRPDRGKEPRRRTAEIESGFGACRFRHEWAHGIAV